jgi:undecaprenyl-diphosphatase
MIDFFQAFIQGIVEGITEFLPISSTGHLIISGRLIGLDEQNVKVSTFEIVIQLGAILAVVILYWQRFIGLFNFNSGTAIGQGRGFKGLNGLVLLALATFPALAIGLLASDFIEKNLFSPVTVAIGFGVGGIAIIVVEQFLPKVKKTGLDSLGWRDALIIGLFQCLALWPGVSRSAATIIGGMLFGVQRKTAAEFSFFAAVPVLVAASAYKLLKNLKSFEAADIPYFAVGFVVSFIFAWLAVKFFIKLLSTTTMVPFGIYRIFAALFVVALIVTSVIKV